MLFDQRLSHCLIALLARSAYAKIRDGSALGTTASGRPQASAACFRDDRCWRQAVVPIAPLDGSKGSESGLHHALMSGSGAGAKCGMNRRATSERPWSGVKVQSMMPFVVINLSRHSS